MHGAPSQKRLPDPQGSLDTEAVLLVTQYYRPEVLGSAPYCADMAEHLAQGRARVTVLTTFPHYPEADRFDRSALGSEENINGVRVKRVRSVVPTRHGAVQRIIAELSFFLAGLWALVSGRSSRHSLVVALCPSIFSIALGRIARKKGGRLVAVVHDIQSGLANSLGIVANPLVHNVMRYCERAILNRADLVIVLSAEMKLELRRIGVVRRIQVVPIWVDTDSIVPAPQRTGHPKLLYSGNMGRKQGLDQLLAMAKILQSVRPEIEIIFRGGGRERTSIQSKVADLGLQNIHFDELLPLDQFSNGLADGDIHLVPQDPVAAPFAVPSKIASIMAAGRAFIATANRGSALWRLRRESRAFITVPANDNMGLTKAVLTLLDNVGLRSALGRRARLFAEDHFARTKLLERFRELLVEVRPSSPALLIFEPEHQGHQLEWLRHLIRYAKAELPGVAVCFAVAPELLPGLTDELGDDGEDNVRILPIAAWEAALCRSRRLVVSAFARWAAVLRYALRTRAGSIHILALDHLSLPLAFGLGMGGQKITGTLFRPSVHYRLIGKYRPSLPEHIRDLRKALLYRLMLQNRSLGTVLSLDPYFPDYAKQFYGGGQKVQLLHDPAHPASHIENSERAVADRLPKGRVNFLHFGYLTERKGTLVLVEAMKCISAEYRHRIGVMLAGRADPAIRNILLEKWAALKQECPELHLELEERRLSAGELEAVVQRAHVLLAPYQRFVGSSGVLLWAARAGKPIVTQDFGLMGPLVREFGLGAAVDTTDPGTIARAMMDIVDDGARRVFDRRGATDFSLSHSPQAFASAIFAGL